MNIMPAGITNYNRRQKMKQDITRKCIVSGELLEKDKLLRFIATPDGDIVPDFKRKLGGKGIYVTNAKSLLDKAIKQNLFTKALKHKVRVSDNMSDIVENILHNQALHALSLARKAGCLIWGLDKVLDAIKRQKVELLFETGAKDSDGHSKVVSHAGDLEICELFNINELDDELKRENTAHLALLKGAATAMVKEAVDRWAFFKSN